MRRRRIGTVGFDQKVIQDVGMAALAVRILPMVINNFFPLDQTLYTAVGAGTGYLTGSFLKNKTMANASIAIGLVEFISPAIENLIGGFGGVMTPSVVNRIPKSMPPRKNMPAISDYINLNDYVPAPSNRHYSDYSDYY